MSRSKKIKIILPIVVVLFLGAYANNSYNKKSWVGKDSIIHANAVSVHFRYPDRPKDAESLMIDPIEKLIYIISKRSDSVTVYTSPLIFKSNDTLTLTKRCKLHFSGFRPFK